MNPDILSDFDNSRNKKNITEDVKTIYNMALHEDLRVDQYVYVLRVPGGWVYQNYLNDSMSSVFVPFSNEFQK